METETGSALHVKARFERASGYPERFPTPDQLVSWDADYPDYVPPYHVSPLVLQNDYSRNAAGWADPEDISLVAEIPSRSFSGELLHDALGRPLNPAGRTGIAGRGLLGKWGPNYAADPIITRINRRDRNVEMLAIKRRDNGQWAIPGGMVDRGEDVSRTLARELLEETGIALDMSEGILIYRGYVDDPRNTDNAWMETTAKLLHLDPETAEKMNPKAGSDAGSVQWLPLITKNISDLYASHCSLVKAALAELCRSARIVLAGGDREIVEALVKTL